MYLIELKRWTKTCPDFSTIVYWVRHGWKPATIRQITLVKRLPPNCRSMGGHVEKREAVIYGYLVSCTRNSIVKALRY